VVKTTKPTENEKIRKSQQPKVTSSMEKDSKESTVLGNSEVLVESLDTLEDHGKFNSNQKFSSLGWIRLSESNQIMLSELQSKKTKFPISDTDTTVSASRVGAIAAFSALTGTAVLSLLSYDVAFIGVVGIFAIFLFASIFLLKGFIKVLKSDRKRMSFRISAESQRLKTLAVKFLVTGLILVLVGFLLLLGQIWFIAGIPFFLAFISIVVAALLFIISLIIR